MKLPLDENEIAAESASLDRLARRLVGNPADAEDIVQDAWLAAIESPPDRFVNVRGWLHRVTGFTASRFKRTRSTRRTREEFAASPEAVPSTIDVELRGEPFRLLAGAVERLPEPYRTVLVLRYYENESVADMAEFLGRTPGTVRSQVKRGLDRVREDLDRQYGGERTTWMSALAAALPAALPMGEEAGAAGGVAAAWIGAGVLISVAIPTIAAWTLGGGSGPEGDVHQIADVAALGLDAREELVVRERAETSAPLPADRRSVAEPVVDELTTSASVAVADPTSARIHVYTDEERAPLADFGVVLERVGAASLPLERRTDSRGEIELEDIAPGEWLISPQRGEAKAAWIAAGERAEIELGVAAGFELNGIVVDAQGEPAPGVDIWLSLPGRADQGSFVARSDANGKYKVAGVDARSWIGVWPSDQAVGPVYSLSSPALEGLADGVELSLPDSMLGLGRNATCRGVVRNGSGEPVAGAAVSIWVDAMKEPVTERTGLTWQWPPVRTVYTDDEGRFVAQRVRATRNRVIVSAPGFAPWFGLSRNDPDERLEIELSGEASVHGRLSLADGGVASEAWVEIIPPSPFAKVVARTDESGAFRVGGLPAGPCRLRASSGQVGASCVMDFETVPGGAVELNGRLDLDAAVHGSLLDARAQPLSDWWVALHGNDGEVKRVRTSESGAFAFPACFEGDYKLAANASDSIGGELVTVTGVRPGPESIVLEVPDDAYPSAWLGGCFTGLDPSEAFGARATLRAIDDSRSQVFATELIGDGSEWCFEIGPVPAGEFALSIDRPGFGETELERMRLGHGERRDLGAVKIDQPGRFELRLITPDGPPPDCMLVELERAELLWTANYQLGKSHEGLVPGADGTVRGGPLPPGRYALRVRTLRYADLFVEIDVESGATNQFEHVLVHGSAMGLELQIPDPLPPDSILEVRFTHEDGEELSDNARPTGAYGEERFLYTLRPGEYEVEVLLGDRRLGRTRFQHPKPGRRLNRVPLTLDR